MRLKQSKQVGIFHSCSLFGMKLPRKGALCSQYGQEEEIKHLFICAHGHVSVVLRQPVQPNPN